MRVRQGGEWTVETILQIMHVFLDFLVFLQNLQELEILFQNYSRITSIYFRL